MSRTPIVCLLVATASLASAQPTDRASRVAQISGRYDATCVSTETLLPDSFAVSGAGLSGVANVRQGRQSAAGTNVSVTSTARVTGEDKETSLSRGGFYDPRTQTLRVIFSEKTTDNGGMVSRLLGQEPKISFRVIPVDLTPDAAGVWRGSLDGAPVAFRPVHTPTAQATSAQVAVKPDGGRVLLKTTGGASELNLVSYGLGDAGWIFYEWAERDLPAGRFLQVTGSRLNLRAGPGTNTRRVSQARQGETFPVVALEDGWAQLALPDGQTAWAYAKLLAQPSGRRARQIVARLTLEVYGDGWRGTYAKLDGGSSVEMTLARRLRVLSIASNDSSDGGAFRVYANQVGNFYVQERRFAKATRISGKSMNHVIEVLEAAGRAGLPYDRVVFIGHGGWDGPIVGEWNEEGEHQASGDDEPELWDELVGAIRRGTTANAMIYASSCHAGGSDRHERKRSYDDDYIWSADLAARTGRVVAGPAGPTSTEYTLRQVKAALESEGTVVQETLVASPGGTFRAYPGQSLLEVMSRSLASK